MKKILVTTAVASAAIPSLQAQISYFSVNQTINGPAGAIFLDLDDGDFGFSSFSDADLSLTFLSNDQLRAQSSNGWSMAGAGGDDEGLARHYGSTSDYVTVSEPRISLYLHNSARSGYQGFWNDNGGPYTGYLGLKNADGREAWVQMTYDDPGNDLTVIDFGVAPESQNLKFGEVPEPAETAAIMALLAGGVAVYQRRRKARAA